MCLRISEIKLFTYKVKVKVTTKSMYCIQRLFLRKLMVMRFIILLQKLVPRMIYDTTKTIRCKNCVVRAFSHKIKKSMRLFLSTKRNQNECLVFASTSSSLCPTNANGVSFRVVLDVRTLDEIVCIFYVSRRLSSNSS